MHDQHPVGPQMSILYKTQQNYAIIEALYGLEDQRSKILFTILIFNTLYGCAIKPLVGHTFSNKRH